MEEIKKNPELTEQQLETVSGGVSYNGNGTYTFKNGDTLIQDQGRIKNIVIGDHENVDGEAIINTTQIDTLRNEEYGVSYKAYYLYQLWLNADPGSTPIG